MDSVLNFFGWAFFVFARARAHAFERSSMILVLLAALAPLAAAAPANRTKAAADLRGADKKAKFAALKTLEGFRDASAGASVAAALAAESDLDVRLAALDSLARLGDAAQVPAVTPLLNDASPVVRHRAALTLAVLGGRQAEAALVSRLSTESRPDVKGAVLRGLAGCASESSLPAIQAAAGDSDPTVRSHAQAIVKRLNAQRRLRDQSTGGTRIP